MEDAVRLTDDTTDADAGGAFPLTLPEDPTDLRLALHRNGYRPVPVLGAHVAMKAAGKRPMMGEIAARLADAGWRVRYVAAATADTVEQCLARPRWRLSLQTHKWIGAP